MIVKSVRVQNFRSILDATLPCEQLTALVGANGAGKSSFLKAIELFYLDTPKPEIEDFYNKNTSNDIVISVTFGDLQQEAKTLFARYLQNDEITVDRVFRWKDDKCESKLHGSLMRNPEFDEIRNPVDQGANPAHQKYDALRAIAKYSSLPVWKSLPITRENLKGWEETHLGDCVRGRDDGQFFGFREVGAGYLGKYTMLRFIPAVEDASEDAVDVGKSVISQLMDLVVRNEITEKPEIKTFQEETKKKYSELIDTSKLTGLATLSDRMNKTMQGLVPDSKISLTWAEAKELEMTLPRAEVRLIEDGYESTVARTGHGLQRAFIMTILQHLSELQSKHGLVTNSDSAQSNLPGLLLIIEEPELYQHPDRQRHLAKVLQNLSKSKTLGVSNSTQVIYSTHSPHFVNIENFDQIRLFRKVAIKKGNPRATKINFATLKDIANDIGQLGGDTREQSDEAAIAQLHAVMTPLMNEGFFADAVVLVEGEEDRAALLGDASNRDIDLESKGFSIIPCLGKSNITRPGLIFRKLGIPMYLIWDGDKGGKQPDPALNHILLKLMGQPPQDWPSIITERFACFEKTLAETLHSEIGKDNYERALGLARKKYSIRRRAHAVKNPVVIAEIFRTCKIDNLHSNTLEEIMDEILKMVTT